MELEGNIADVEKKVAKILKLIKNKDKFKKDGFPRELKKETELVRLVEDFHKQYQSLFALYDNLKAESEKKARGRKGKERFSTSTSSSESEYYSSEDTENNRSRLKSERLKAALSKIHDAETINKKLRNEVDEQAKELASLVKTSEVPGNQESGQRTDLEDQLTSLKNELESLYCQKRDLEAQLVFKAAEAKQLGEKNKVMEAKVLELQLMAKRGDGCTDLLNEPGDNKDNLSFKVVELMEQVSILQSEVDSLRAEKSKFEENLICRRDESLKQYLESMHNKQAELEVLLEKRTKEMSQYLFQVETLKEELARKTTLEQKMLEKEGFLVQVMDLELEVETFCKQKNDVEEQMRSKICETSQLKDDMEGLQDKILELKGSPQEEGNQPSNQKNSQAEDEASVQIVTLKANADYLQQELDSLKTRNHQLELHLEGERQEHSQSLSQMEDQNMTLTSKIAEQQRILNEQEKTINKFLEDSKQVKRWSWSTGTSNSKVNHHVLERKMEVLAEEFRKKLEDNIRLLHQRIRVAEKMHYENKENFRKTGEKFEQENVALKERLAIYEAESKKLRATLEPGIKVAGKTHYENEENNRKTKETFEQENTVLKERLASYAAESKKLRARLEPGINALVGLDLAVRKLEDNGNFLTRMSNVKNGLVFAKNWASGKNNEIKQLESNMNSVVAKLDDKEEQELLLREKVWNLEALLRKEVGEKLNLIEEVNQLEKRIKDKDDKLSGLGEEKREAIRQLCLLIDYHRCRYNGLKELISIANVINRT
ncbi:hypothetical protein SLE2022_230070 [Rubroshorea leprosula]